MSDLSSSNAVSLVDRARAWLWPAAPDVPPVSASSLRSLHVARRLLGSVEQLASSIDGSTHASRVAMLSTLRTAALWALRASAEDAIEPVQLSEAFDAARAHAVRAAGGSEALAEIEHVLVHEGPAEDDAREEGALVNAVNRARVFVTELVHSAEERAGLVEGVRRVRARRVGLVLAAIAAVVLGWAPLRRKIKPELAHNARWTASSQQDEWAKTGVGFHPFEGRPNVFFHTQTEFNPWIEFDLGAEKTVEQVWVQNRLECCQDRAKPLFIETSLDHTRWFVVASNKEDFYYWTANFRPHPARWVRLRTPRVTNLHLGAVEIH